MAHHTTLELVLSLTAGGGRTVSHQVSKALGNAKLQRNHTIKDTLNKGHLSNEDTVHGPIHRAVYKSTSELGTPLNTGQPAVSR